MRRALGYPRPVVTRALVVFLAVLGCGGSSTPTPAADAPAPAKVAILDTKAIEAPKHDFAAMAASDAEAPKVAATGSFSATFDGKPRPFPFLPSGLNAASWVEDTKVARVQIGAAANDREGYPYLRIVLEGARLDQLQLPKTFAFSETKDADGVRASITYEIADRKLWNADTAAGDAGSVTLESFAGNRVTGSFTAKLAPRSSAFGSPISITDGKFSIDLRLRGIAPRQP